MGTPISGNLHIAATFAVSDHWMTVLDCFGCRRVQPRLLHQSVDLFVTGWSHVHHWKVLLEMLQALAENHQHLPSKATQGRHLHNRLD